jgi:hypothetical protein
VERDYTRSNKGRVGGMYIRRNIRGSIGGVNIDSNTSRKGDDVGSIGGKWRM